MAPRPPHGSPRARGPGGPARNRPWGAALGPEHHRGPPRRIHERGDAEVPVNRSRVIALRSASLTVVGLDDLRHGHPRPDLFDRILSPTDTQIKLFHEPAQADRPESPRAAAPSLMLAGHARGGQIRLPLRSRADSQKERTLRGRPVPDRSRAALRLARRWRERSAYPVPMPGGGRVFRA